MFEFTSVICPHCWANVEVPVDGAEGVQEYVEDCSVCCRAMRLRVQVGRNGEIADVDVSRDDG